MILFYPNLNDQCLLDVVYAFILTGEGICKFNNTFFSCAIIAILSLPTGLFSQYATVTSPNTKLVQSLSDHCNISVDTFN